MSLRNSDLSSSRGPTTEQTGVAGSQGPSGSSSESDESDMVEDRRRTVDRLNLAHQVSFGCGSQTGIREQVNLLRKYYQAMSAEYVLFEIDNILTSLPVVL